MCRPHWLFGYSPKMQSVTFNVCSPGVARARRVKFLSCRILWVDNFFAAKEQKGYIVWCKMVGGCWGQQVVHVQELVFSEISCRCNYA